MNKLYWLMLPAFLGFACVNPAAQDNSGKVEPFAGKVLDLVFRVEATGGTVEALDIKESATEVRIDLAADVLFDFDKADILPKAEPTLQRAADFIQQKSQSLVTIEGHTDSVGNGQYNQKLSERRAEAVRKWLAAHGVKSPMSTRGYGKSRPIAPNTLPGGKDNPEGRQKNRRVEIVIKKS